jgi:hypothetical protein
MQDQWKGKTVEASWFVFREETHAQISSVVE